MIRKNGVLQMHGTDLRSLCLGYVTGEIDDENFNKFVNPLLETLSYLSKFI